MIPLSIARLGAYFLCCGLAFTALIFLAGCGDSGYGGARPHVDSSDTRAKTIVQLLSERDSLSRFQDLLERAGLQEQVETYGPWTVFVPEDDAFQRAAYRLDSLMRTSRLDSLSQVASYHIVRGRIDTSDVRGRGDSLQISTLYEEPLTMYRRGARFTVNGAAVLGLIPAQNGMVYVLDTVLELPPPDTTAQQDILFF